jgi:retron-type reverse transcriptase
MSCETVKERVEPIYDPSKERVYGKNLSTSGPLRFNQLYSAFVELRTNGGKAAGPDGLRFDSLSDGQWLLKLRHVHERLADKTYAPGLTRLKSIAKQDGGKRELHIANILDRCVQKAVGTVVSNQIDTKFKPWSFGFRPKLSTFHMLLSIESTYLQGFTHVCVMDINKAFDCVRKRDVLNALDDLGISDRPLRELIGLLVSCGGRENVGLNQGSALSPVLFNAFLDAYFDKPLEDHSRFDCNKQIIFRYADDIVLMGRDSGSVNDLANIATAALDKKHLSVSTKNVADIKTSPVTILGFQLYGRAHRIEYRTSDRSWSKLLNNLDACHQLKDPVGSARQVLQGWLNSNAPVDWSEEHEGLTRILESVSLDLNPADLKPDQSVWKDLREEILKDHIRKPQD